MFAALMMAATAGCQADSEHYAARCSLPLEGWGREADGLYELRPVMPVQLASDGSLLWDRVSISDDTLREHLFEASRMSVPPQIILEVAPSADCRRVSDVRAIMDQSPVCKEGGCSEGWRHETWPLSSVS